MVSPKNSIRQGVHLFIEKNIHQPAADAHLAGLFDALFAHIAKSNQIFYQIVQTAPHRPHADKARNGATGLALSPFPKGQAYW